MSICTNTAHQCNYNKPQTGWVHKPGMTSQNDHTQQAVSADPVSNSAPILV